MKELIISGIMTKGGDSTKRSSMGYTMVGMAQSALNKYASILYTTPALFSHCQRSWYRLCSILSMTSTLSHYTTDGYSLHVLRRYLFFLFPDTSSYPILYSNPGILVLYVLHSDRHFTDDGHQMVTGTRGITMATVYYLQWWACMHINCFGELTGQE